MRIKDKIKEIEEYSAELFSAIPANLELESYKKDFRIKAICERYFEKIIEAIVDLAFLMIKDRKLKIPEEDTEAFDILANENIISSELAQKLKEAKGMRNIIAHEYGKIDDEIVFNSMTEELERDIKEFIKSIRKFLK
ncbi:MAG: DUF86 domain-containing protein [archaeon]